MPDWGEILRVVPIWVDTLLLLLVAATAAAVVASRSLFSAAMLSGIYSLLMALVWFNLGSMDVAFTEAAVGAGISTILFLGALVWTGHEERQAPRAHWGAFAIVLLTGAALIYGTFAMPGFGDANAPIHLRTSPEYVRQTVPKVAPIPGISEVPLPGNQFDHHVPNVVTAVLASYRGYDTMFETGVIFTAGAIMVLLLRRRERSPAGTRDENEVAS